MNTFYNSLTKVWQGVDYVTFGQASKATKAAHDLSSWSKEKVMTFFRSLDTEQQKQVQNLVSLLAEREQQVSVLQKELEASKEGKSALRSEVRGARRTVKQLTGAPIKPGEKVADALKRVFTQKSGEIMKLQGDLKESARLIESYEKLLPRVGAYLGDEAAGISGNIDSLYADVMAQKAQLVEKDRLLDDVKTEIARIQSEDVEVMAFVDNLIAINDELQSKISDLSSRIESLAEKAAVAHVKDYSVKSPTEMIAMIKKNKRLVHDLKDRFGIKAGAQMERLTKEKEGNVANRLEVWMRTKRPKEVTLEKWHTMVERSFKEPDYKGLSEFGYPNMGTFVKKNMQALRKAFGGTAAASQDAFIEELKQRTSPRQKMDHVS